MSRLKGKKLSQSSKQWSHNHQTFLYERRPWIEQFGFSNSLCTQATQAITNHTPIGEYWLRFFPREEFSYPCKSYPIETRHHILYDCRRFNKYWNLKRDTIGQFVSFLEFNPSAFSFGESITWACGIISALSSFCLVWQTLLLCFFSISIFCLVLFNVVTK